MKTKKVIKTGVVLFSIYSLSKFIYNFVIYDEILDIHKDKNNISDKNANFIENKINNNITSGKSESLNYLNSFISNKDDEKLLEIYTNLLYHPCLTNKLFISSNLYGHELIRYYDF